jgi:hypothetical protein
MEWGGHLEFDSDGRFRQREEVVLIVDGVDAKLVVSFLQLFPLSTPKAIFNLYVFAIHLNQSPVIRR